MTEWFDDFFEACWLRKGAHREPEANFIGRALRLRKGQRVLDAPCGDGGVAIYLAPRGVHVTGVDRMGKFIARARRRFRKESLPGEFHILDLREIDYEEQFHAVYNWGGSFGYFSDAENLDVLRRYARTLRRGGRVLIDQPNREYILRHFRRHTQRGDARITAKWNPRTQRIETVWSRRRGGTPQSRRMSMRFYTPAQFRHLFGRANLEIITIYGDLDGSEYQRGSPRILVVAQKG